MKYESILETIGRTPIIKLAKLAPPHVSIYAKVESFNPMSSIKDRLALAVIEHAERTGALKPGQTVVEATSGNTGIGLAMVCARKGYPLVVVMAESFSLERRRLMRFLGARVVLTPASLKGSGMLAKAHELADTHGWFLPRQFENEANADVHTRTTAQEIIADFEGQRLDYWVTPFGTGGTLKGVARALRLARPDTKIIVAEPDNAPMLASGVAQPEGPGVVPVSHPSFRPHPIQGTSPDFLSKLVNDAVAAKMIDAIAPVNGGDAIRMSRMLATSEGIFAGISSGASVAAALDIAATAPEGSVILCMLPDTGERYLSTPLFEGVPTEMTDEERAISCSTPLAQFAASPASAPAPAAAPAPVAMVDGEAIRLLEQAIGDKTSPVVMFALEWCEFSWSVRRLFDALSIPYRAIDLDSVAYQKEDLGARIRRALSARTGTNTIPQIFIGGRFVGGCSEIFAEEADGALDKRIHALRLNLTRPSDLQTATLLPNWLSRREPA
jgi:cysteine synthase A